MRRLVLWSTATILAALGLAACATDPAQNHVTLKIAASDNFLPVLRELAQAYHRHQPWVDIELTTGNTAKLEQDLKEGKAYDLYIPSRASSMEALAQKDAINPLSRRLLALNQLMIVSAPDSDLPLDLQAITNPSVRQIAVANPSLLLGHLTRQALTSLRLLPNHEATPLGQPANPSAPGPALPSGLANLAASQSTDLEAKLLVLPSETDVLAAVEDGRAQVGITYASYAVSDKKIRILSSFPMGSYEPVAYNVAIPRNAPHNDEAWQFLSYLRSAEAHAIMQRAGLLVN